jgi:hypothetical protein
VGKTQCYCSQTQFDLNMQVDGYKKTGCFNYHCSGFVQVNKDKEYALGSLVTPVNQIGSAEKVCSFIKIKQVKF